MSRPTLSSASINTARRALEDPDYIKWLSAKASRVGSQFSVTGCPSGSYLSFPEFREGLTHLVSNGGDLERAAMNLREGSERLMESSDGQFVMRSYKDYPTWKMSPIVGFRPDQDRTLQPDVLLCVSGPKSNDGRVFAGPVSPGDTLGRTSVEQGWLLKQIWNEGPTSRQDMLLAFSSEGKDFNQLKFGDPLTVVRFNLCENVRYITRRAAITS